MCTYIRTRAYAGTCLRRHVPTCHCSRSRAHRRVSTLSHTHHATHHCLPSLRGTRHTTQITPPTPQSSRSQNTQAYYSAHKLSRIFCTQRVVEGLIQIDFTVTPRVLHDCFSNKLFYSIASPPLPSSPTGIRCAIDLRKQHPCTSPIAPA